MVEGLLKRVISAVSHNKLQKIRLKSDFKKLKKCDHDGSFTKGKFLVMKFLPSDEFSFAISISSAVGVAAVRNKIRRRVSEIVRIFHKEHPLPQYKILFLGRKAAKDANYQNLLDEITRFIENIC